MAIKDVFNFEIFLQIRVEINKNKKSNFQFFLDIFGKSTFKTAFS